MADIRWIAKRITDVHLARRWNQEHLGATAGGALFRAPERDEDGFAVQGARFEVIGPEVWITRGETPRVDGGGGVMGSRLLSRFLVLALMLTLAWLPLIAAAPVAAQEATPDAGSITFRPPVILGDPSFPIVAAVVSNTTSQVKSFTVKTTFKQGDTIVATAGGAVNDLRPGEYRAATMLATGPIPPYDSARVDVDTLVEDAPTTPGAEVAAKLSFGPPALTGVGSLPQLSVEVTNHDTVAHSFTVSAAFLRGGTLIGVASGAVNDLGPGATKTASLLIQGTSDGMTGMFLGPETIVQ